MRPTRKTATHTELLRAAQRNAAAAARRLAQTQRTTGEEYALHSAYPPDWHSMSDEHKGIWYFNVMRFWDGRSLEEFEEFPGLRQQEQ